MHGTFLRLYLLPSAPTEILLLFSPIQQGILKTEGGMIRWITSQIYLLVIFFKVLLLSLIKHF